MATIGQLVVELVAETAKFRTEMTQANQSLRTLSDQASSTRQIFNTFAGVRCTDPLLVNVVRSFGGTDRDLYAKVILPSVVPYVVAAARLAIGRGLIGILVGEFYAASEGLGFAISRFGDTYRLPEMFAGIVVLAVVAVGLTSAVRRLEAIVAPWRAGQS